jgi:hypothetical protein
MKSLFNALLVTLGLAIATVSFGHSDHHHPAKKPVTEDVAKKNAQDSIGNLIKGKKIDDSWSKADFVSIE